MTPAAKPKEDPAATNWHVDRRIPLALIVTVVGAFAGQLIGLLWWASGVNQRIDEGARANVQLAQADVAIAAQVKEVQDANSDVNVRLVRFEVLLEGATDQLKEQRSLLTQIRDSVGPPKK